MARWRDYMCRTDLSDQTYFPFEPRGNLTPKVQKNVVIEASMPSHDEDGTLIPSVETIRDEGIDDDAGIFSLSGSGMPQATFEIFDGFFKSNPPENFLYHKARANAGKGLTYLVNILDFQGEPETGRTKLSWSMELKNLGVVT